MATAIDDLVHSHRPYVRNVLAIWGAFSLLLLAVIMLAIAYYFTIGVKPRNGRATKHDVRFVLNWPQLGDERIEEVVESHESSVHFNGDHFTELPNTREASSV